MGRGAAVVHNRGVVRGMCMYAITLSVPGGLRLRSMIIHAFHCFVQKALSGLRALSEAGATAVRRPSREGIWYAVQKMRGSIFVVFLSRCILPARRASQATTH